MARSHSGSSPSRPYRFELSGGALCLDFVNTLEDRPLRQSEHLTSFADLVAWAVQAGLLDGSGARALARRASRRPAERQETFRRALELRESLFRIFAARAAGRQPRAGDLSRLNRALGAAMRAIRIEPDDEGYRWSWTDANALDAILRPVVRSAAELLTSSELQQVRQCASDRCSWLFVDRSRSRRRRWCDMKTCGNRAKARRHYQRRKAMRIEDKDG